jgi:hypothetical protein
VAAIHFPEANHTCTASGKWMAGTSPAMTDARVFIEAKTQIFSPAPEN